MSTKLKWKGRHNQSLSGRYEVREVRSSCWYATYMVGSWKRLGVFPTRELAKEACQKHYDEQCNEVKL